MATIGLSKPFYAVYANNGTTVSYSNGGALGKFTELSLELNDGGDNVLYADNAPAESDPSFAGGSITISTDDLRPDVAKVILGMSEEAISGSGQSSSNKWLVANDAQVIPYLGIGGVIKKKVDGAIKYVAFVLDKVQFRMPGKSATTQGQTIVWQVPQLEAEIFRSDKTNHDWYRESTLLTTEAEAVAAVKAYLSIT